MIGIPAITIFAVTSMVMMCLAVFAFRSPLRGKGGERDATWWWMMGFTSMAFAANARSFYWDVVWSLMRDYNPETAYRWREAVNGTDVNILFYLPMIFGAFCILKCKQKMIAEEELIKLPWWKAWLHPDSIRIFRWPRF